MRRMRSPQGQSRPRPVPEDAQPVPFAAVPVTLTKQEHIQWVMDASYWHADETRWAVFVELAGKVGHRWYRWVFHSSSPEFDSLRR